MVDLDGRPLALEAVEAVARRGEPVALNPAAKRALDAGRAFVDRLASHDVFVGPGEIFEMPGYFRLSLTANDDMVTRALPGFEAARMAVSAS